MRRELILTPSKKYLVKLEINQLFETLKDAKLFKNILDEMMKTNFEQINTDTSFLFPKVKK